MAGNNKINDSFDIRRTSEHVCEIAFYGPGLAENQETTIGKLCGMFLDQYEGPAKLITFWGIGKDFHACDDQGNQAGNENNFIHNKRIELLLEIISRVPYFSVSLTNGRVEDVGADIAVACDWRLASETSQFCFTSCRKMEDVVSGGRLAELIGGFKAFDSILRRRYISAHEAVRIGLAMPIDQDGDFVQIIENHIKAMKKESITIMRRAVRSAFPNDGSVERIVRSISTAN